MNLPPITYSTPTPYSETPSNVDDMIQDPHENEYEQIEPENEREQVEEQTKWVNTMLETLKSPENPREFSQREITRDLSKQPKNLFKTDMKNEISNLYTQNDELKAHIKETIGELYPETKKLYKFLKLMENTKKTGQNQHKIEETGKERAYKPARKKLSANIKKINAQALRETLIQIQNHLKKQVLDYESKRLLAQQSRESLEKGKIV